MLSWQRFEMCSMARPSTPLRNDSSFTPPGIQQRCGTLARKSSLRTLCPDIRERHLPKTGVLNPGTRVALVDVAADVRAELAAAVARRRSWRNKTEPLDLILLTTKSHSELRQKFPVLDEHALAPNGAPDFLAKENVGRPSDLDENKVRAR